MRFLFLALFILIISPFVKSQDVHLTQYYTSNQSLNPAYTGSFYGDMKFVVNSRSQWGQISTPIKTNFFSVEKRLLNRFPDEIGVGFIIMNDQLSSSYLQSNKVMLSGSYQKEFRKNIFRVGIQGGLVFKSIHSDNMSFPDQWDYQTGGYTKTLNEPDLKNSRVYPNFSIGTGWTRRFGSAKVVAGYALFNLTRPNDGFQPIKNVLPFRHVFNSSVIYSLSAKTNLIPHLLYMRTAKATDFILGTNVSYLIKDHAGILLGAGYRGSSLNSDAVTGTAGLNYKRFQFGFSMDFTVSQLNLNARNKSAWEIMISYTTPSRIPGKVTLPCDRY